MDKYIFCDIEFESKQKKPLKSFTSVYRINKVSTVKYWLWGILIVSFIILMLPWTQNIRAKGLVTTLRQEQRPQELNNIVPGKVLKWYVKEGDYVKQGDTILQLGEVKVEYFDPQLLARTRQQIEAKKTAIDAYTNKAETAGLQVEALKSQRDFKLSELDIKLSQQRLKVQADSMDIIAVRNELQVAQRQIDAAKLMLDSGVISLVDYERRTISFQNATAKIVSAENKYMQSRQELSRIQAERAGTIQEYIDKINKTTGERFSALSDAATGEADVAKMENLYSNYDIRNQQFYITAPQNGQITKARKAGIGEVVKEGDMIVEIVPNNIQYAVEMFVEPFDLPLVAKGQKVRFIFDGFPAIIFSGWPNFSYGTFGGIVVAVENSASANGKFRVLVIEDFSDKRWPPLLRIGGGANGIALLKDVPIWYELWRNINGFPREYYKPEEFGAPSKGDDKGDKGAKEKKSSI